jgi:hypothetical protein
MLMKIKNFKFQFFKSLSYNFARKGVPTKNTIFDKFSDEFSEVKPTKKQQKEMEAELEVGMFK